MANPKLLIFIPTYNEAPNVELMCQRLLDLPLEADILFLDDNSPDGTGDVLDNLAQQHSNVSVIHRSGKLGIGTAHQEGIATAYDRGYDILVTMDCDFTHSPEDIPQFLELGKTHDVVVGNRYQQADSLSDWSAWRRVITKSAHFMTAHLLGMPQDATGAFRAYDLRKIPRGVFALVAAKGYAFFFESLFVLTRNGFTIGQVPIKLSARFLGNSKLSLDEALRGIRQLFAVSAAFMIEPARFAYVGAPATLDETLNDPQGWDAYWEHKDDAANLCYAVVATIYRNLVIKRCLSSTMLRLFKNGSRVMHAGCGSGQVDTRLQKYLRITAVDISPPALQIYRRTVPRAHEVRHASILDLPFEAEAFDGIYNLGVMEHFYRPDLDTILQEFHRVLRMDGKLVLFWPHRFASSALVLDSVHALAHRSGKNELMLHPPEVTRAGGRAQMEELLAANGFRLAEYYFGPADGFVQVQLVAVKS